MENSIYEKFMSLAIDEAKKAKTHGDWPFGAVVVKEEIVVGKGYAQDKSGGDVTNHAELVAIQDACRNLQSNNLQDCAIYCTNEPCLMCASGIFQANIGQVIIGVSRDDLSQLLRPRKLRIEDLAADAGHKIKIVKGILRDKIMNLFSDIKKTSSS